MRLVIGKLIDSFPSFSTIVSHVCRWLFSSSLLSFGLVAGFQTPWFYCQSGCLSTVSCMLHKGSLIRQLAPKRHQFYILLVYVF